jgi:hypothetical protein
MVRHPALFWPGNPLPGIDLQATAGLVADRFSCNPACKPENGHAQVVEKLLQTINV